MSVKFRALESAIQNGAVDRISKALNSTKSDVSISSFLDQNDPLAKQSILSLMQLVLPLTCHDDVKLRMQSQSFVSYWGSLLSAFSPNLLRSVFSEIDTTTLQPAAQAALFTFWAHSLRSVAPHQREQLVGTCHSLLLTTKSEYLTHVTMDVWAVIRETMSLETLKSIIVFLADSPLAQTVAFLCQKSPNYYFDIIVKRASLQFIKEMLGFWPKERQIDITLLKEMLLTNLNGSNSSLKSTSIEICNILLTRYNDQHPSATDTAVWKEMFEVLLNIYNNSTIAQKAAIIDTFALATKCGLVSLDSMEQFLVYNNQIPSPLLVSIIHLTGHFIKKNKIPNLFLPFIRKMAIERDPIIFISILEMLTDSFNELYKIVPEQTTELLNLCLTPLSRYFVEQIHIIQLLKNIDFTVFNESKMKVSPMTILLTFIEDPHPSVIQEVPSFIEKLNLQLPLTSLNWFENANSYLPLMENIDPSFVVELIDACLLPPASYELSINTILSQVRQQKTLQNPNLLYQRVLNVIIAGMKALGLPYERLLTPMTNEWEYITNSLPSLLDMVTEPLLSSTFGKILNSSVLILASIISQVTNLTFYIVSSLLDICKVLSPAFTEASCTFAVALKRLVDKRFKKNRTIFKEKLATFFEQQFPFESAEPVAISSIQVSLNSHCAPYVITAAETSRKVLSKLAEKSEELPHGPAFLAAKNNIEYMKQCAKEIPFDDWIYENEDEETLLQFSDIIINDFTTLTNTKKKVALKHKELFKFNEEVKYEESTEKIKLPTLEPNEPIFMSLPLTENPLKRSQESAPKWYKTLMRNHTLSSTYLASENSTEFESSTDDKVPEEEDDGIEGLEGAPKDWKDIKVLPDTIYPHRDQNFADLLGFLWFSFRKLSMNEWRIVEYYVLNQTEDERMLAACLAYASRNNFPILKDKWCNKLTLDRKHFKLLSMTLLLFLLNKPLSRTQAVFIEDVIIELGYITAGEEENILRALKQERGLALLCIQQIAFLLGYSTHQTVATKSDVIHNIDNILLNCSDENLPRTLALIFDELPSSFIDRFELPPGVPSLKLTLPAAIEIVPPQRTKLDVGLVEKLLVFCDNLSNEVIKENKESTEGPQENENPQDGLTQFLYLSKSQKEDLFLFISNLLRHCELDHDQEDTYEDLIIDNFGISCPIANLKLLRLYPTLSSYRRVSSGVGSQYGALYDMAQNLPPSFTRGLAQCFLSRNVEINDEYRKLFATLPKVFYELLPLNFEKISKDLVNKSLFISEESCLYVRPVTKQILAQARQTMVICESAAPRLTEQLLHLDDLKLLFNSANDETAVSELCQQLLTLANSEFRYIHNVINIMDILIKSTPIDSLIMMAVSATFTNGKNFVSILIVIDMITKQISKNHPENVSMSVETLNQMVEGILTDEKRKELFREKDKCLALSVALSNCL